MRAFVVGTGRCGSVSFSRACQHAVNVTVGHESNQGRPDYGRLAYPDAHIEVDPRLTWSLALLLEEYPEARFVHLTRRSREVARSWIRRMREKPVAETYHSGLAGMAANILGYRLAELGGPQERLEAALWLCRVMRRQCEYLLEPLRQRGQALTVDLSELPERWHEVWDFLELQGDFDRSAAEWDLRHNASWQTDTQLPENRRPMVRFDRVAAKGRVAVGKKEGDPGSRATRAYEGGVAAQRTGLPEKPTGNGWRGRTDARERRQDVLLEFRHGLGDAVQLTLVLAHLRTHRPDWNVDVAALLGKHSALFGLARQVRILDEEAIDRAAYGRVYPIPWHECQAEYAEAPSTKASRCLREIFGISPEAALCRYTIATTPAVRRAAESYLEGICGPPGEEGRFPAVLIHYEGNTSAESKNLPHALIGELCETVRAAGHVPVILDWDGRSPLPDGRRIFNPGAGHPLWNGLGTGDAETLAALIEASELVVGVDSGPLHVAGATSTPTLGVWTGHHPVHYFDLADNVVHLVPQNHRKLARGKRARKFFETHYRFQTYERLAVDLPAVVESRLTGTAPRPARRRHVLTHLKATRPGYAEYERHRAEGRNDLDYGAWQAAYGRWLVESLELGDQRVLDVGCRGGALVKGLQEAGAEAEGIDLNEFLVALGRHTWPELAERLRVCHAGNLHYFEEGAFAAVHAHRSLAGWPPERVGLILGELHRVTRSGGLFVGLLSPREASATRPRRVLRPMAWWHAQLQEAGWEVVTREYRETLRAHPASFFREADGDWFVALRGPS